MMLRAEFMRLSRAGALPALLFIAVGLNALSVYGNSTQLAPDGVSQLSAAAMTVKLVGLGFGASLFSMIFGALSVTRDFANRSLGRVKQLAGSTERLFVVRALVVAPALLAFGVLGAASACVVAWLSLPAVGSEFVWSHDAKVIVVGVVASTFLAGYLGQCIAWQSRKSLVTVVVLVAWTLLLETYIIQLVPAVGRLLPGGLTQAMLLDTSSTDQILDPRGGYIGYCLWLLVLGASALLRLRRTDFA